MHVIDSIEKYQQPQQFPPEQEWTLIDEIIDALETARLLSGLTTKEILLRVEWVLPEEETELFPCVQCILHGWSLDDRVQDGLCPRHTFDMFLGGTERLVDDFIETYELV